MNEYIFYTAEGYTTAPNENYEVENCQMLGTAKGNDPYEAKQTLLKNCPWIQEAGYDPDEMMFRQLLLGSHENLHIIQRIHLAD